MSDHDSANPQALPEETRSIVDAIDLLRRAINLNELMFMAGEGISEFEMKEAITTGADVINDILQDLKGLLYAIYGRNGGVK